MKFTPTKEITAYELALMIPLFALCTRDFEYIEDFLKRNGLDKYFSDD